MKRCGALGISVRRIGSFIVGSSLSVRESQSKLDSARETALMVHYAEGRSQAYGGLSELRTVEKIKDLGAEF